MNIAQFQHDHKIGVYVSAEEEDAAKCTALHPVSGQHLQPGLQHWSLIGGRMPFTCDTCWSHVHCTYKTTSSLDIILWKDSGVYSPPVKTTKRFVEFLLNC